MQLSVGIGGSIGSTGHQVVEADRVVGGLPEGLGLLNQRQIEAFSNTIIEIDCFMHNKRNHTHRSVLGILHYVA